MLSLADVENAARAIQGRVRRTPMMAAAPDRLGLDCALSLKVESLQVTGSFKARGALNKLLALDAAQIERGLVTASGGNHGAAVAYAGWIAQKPVTVYAPANIAALKAQKIEAFGARLVREGEVWDVANRAALAEADATGAAYVHPFADPLVAAGNGTVALEILADMPDVETILIAIGGGGLISGMATAAKALKPGIRLVGIEPVGSPTLHASLAAGHVVELERITSSVPTMSCRRTSEDNFRVVRDLVDEVVLVSDAQMLEASRALWLEFGIAADLSGAASLATLMARAYVPAEGERVCALICGAGPEGTAG